MSKRNGSKHNALRHGAFSREVMLPGEKRTHYEAFRRAHYAEFVPNGIVEECVVDELVQLRWKKRRLHQYDQVRLQQRVDDIKLNQEAYRHRANLKNLAPEFTNASSLKAVNKIFARVSPQYGEIIRGWVPRDEGKDPAEWGPAIGKFLSNLTIQKQLYGVDLFAEMVGPDTMEKDISRSIRLDEAIDRKIKQLMQIKASKQMFPEMREHAASDPKLISAEPRAKGRGPMVIENEPKAALEIESVVSSAQGKDNTPVSPHEIDFEHSDTGKAGCDAAGADTYEKEHFVLEPVTVEYPAKPLPVDLAEMRAFSALCNELREAAGYSKEGLAGCV